MAGNLAFLPGMAEKFGYYVYALRDPRRNGEPGRGIFYVGKGHGDRVYQHARAELSAREDRELGLKLNTIREIRREGKEVGVEILRFGMTSDEALEVEAGIIDTLKLAEFPGFSNLIRGQHTERGWKPLTELRAKHAAPCLRQILHRLILIRIQKLHQPSATAEQLYEVTRRWWNCNPAPPFAGGPQVALAIYNGVARAAFWIVNWEMAPAGEKDAGRAGFRGVFADEIDERYIWKNASDFDESVRSTLPPADVLVRQYVWHDVTHLLGKSQNPVKYVSPQVTT